METTVQEERISCLSCGSLDSLNICPRCALAYCSVKCYRSEQHRGCSESFYRECVEQELRLRGDKQKTPRTFEEFMNEQDAENFPIDTDIPGISIFFIYYGKIYTKVIFKKLVYYIAMCI